MESPSGTRSALEDAVREPGPSLLNVKVSPFENVFPMVPAGRAINEMVLGPPQPVAVPKRRQWSDVRGLECRDEWGYNPVP